MDVIRNELVYIQSHTECIQSDMKCIQRNMKCAQDDLECVQSGMNCVQSDLECVQNVKFLFHNHIDKMRSVVYNVQTTFNFFQRSKK